MSTPQVTDADMKHAEKYRERIENLDCEHMRAAGDSGLCYDCGDDELASELAAARREGEIAGVKDSFDRAASLARYYYGTPSWREFIGEIREIFWGLADDLQAQKKERIKKLEEGK